MSFGLAPVFTLSTDLIIGTVPPERAGTAAGLAETSSEFGGALGIAILGSIVTALYAGGMAAFDRRRARRRGSGGRARDNRRRGGAGGDFGRRCR